MNNSTNYAALFYSETDNDIEVLENNVRDFPASSVARFLLLYHHKKNNNPAFEELAKQTAIYLNNPNWSEYQLWQIDNSTGNNSQEIIEKNKENHLPEIKEKVEISASVKEETTEIPFSEIAVNDVENNDNSFAEINEEEELSTPVKEEIKRIPSSEIQSNNVENKENFSTEIKEEEEIPASVKEEIDEIPSSEIVSNNVKNSFAEIKEEEKIPASVKEELNEIPSSEISSVDEEHKESPLEKTNDEEELPSSVKEEIIEIPSSEFVLNDVENKENSLTEIKEEKELPASVKEEIIEIPSSELVPVDDENKDAHLKNIESASEAENKLSTEDDKNSQLENHDLSKEENEFEDKPVLNIKVPDEEINASEENLGHDEDEHEAVAFEPLHTVDYFASQGIKINEEALANDHLVKQVKSFTAWLKSMKKLHPGQMPEQNEVIEKIIQASSESSNKDANVLTEAMAEVLIKQGKREKAMEMYEKLSLINPSKSAYFAAKIENLKIV